MSDWYRSLGVSAHKTFLKAYHPQGYFVSVGPDLAGDPLHSFILHADGVGTKGILAYLWWKETGDEQVWYHLAQDALVMNTDDLACVGATENFVFSTTIARNPFFIPDDVVQALIQGIYAFADWLGKQGISAWVAGGETADMPDVVRTVSLEATAAVRIARDRLLPISRPDTELWIVGLGSFGQTTYEDAYNSGIGCNGITAIRHLLLHPMYKEKYPETVADELSDPYRGEYNLTQEVQGIPLGRLLTSPTRTYLPFLREAYAEYRRGIYAVIHCTGGGQRKALKYLPRTLIRKENFFPLSPLFALLENRRPWPELFEVLNMGHRLELYVLPTVAESLISLAQSYNLPAQVIGSAVPHDQPTRIEAVFRDTTWIWESEV
ncbi:MAG: phosphoribosylformylglycinamidine cyclo-ligase [Bacteroidia bacterium]|nr:phosphoribosylformylglycinamidine cyclo-ligase [Bacteroidia bacterium]